jgi:DNA-binding NtrC family response regulator
MMTMLPLVHQRSTDTKLQITVLSDNRVLMPRLEYCLRTLGANFTCVETIDEANGIANAGKSDITIVDLHGADAWPGHVFQLFDERAASNSVVILCSDANDANHYRERSRYAVDIFPDDAVDDHRFQCVIQAALLRAEAVSSDKREHGIAPAA